MKETKAMKGLYLVGGVQRNVRSMLEREAHWYKYRKGLILRVNPQPGCVEPCTEYISPPDVCADDDPAILFKCGTLHEDKLYVCTQTEVMMYSVPDFHMLAYVSLPSFNDVHHVRPTPEGNLLIAISGLDMVQEITWEGEVLREWNTLGEDPWARFSKDVDYRRIASTKPHHSHPNQVFYVDDDPWVTRFEQQDAISLTDRSKRIEIGVERVHDGVVQGDHIYFTTVNGNIVIANARTLAIDDLIDLNEISESDSLLGWCRGIFLDDGKAWVGFSSVRRTKIKENVAWIREGFKHRRPTHVACYDLATRQCLEDIDVQVHGLDAVFSIFPVHC